ncbi:excinuclease ABC subunit UvrA [Chloroflexia bacterium SDU3-3]|nr:excinuclease ABC subunit UvrA [Chloroflexia bacterium SDU3-3]
MSDDAIVVHGAREHNLKNIDIRIPKRKLVVITGLSGSGKSTLAFDTIFAEGQRRYVESLSAYARQFLGQLNKPDVDAIEGLSPAIAIDQKSGSRSPRSTVGTVTEIYDFLRLLFARVGEPHCPICGRKLARQTAQQIIDALLGMPDGTRLLVLAPLVRQQKGEHAQVLENARRQGFVRVRVDGEVRELDEPIALDRQKPHTIEAVVDRLIIRHADPTAPVGDHPDRTRVADSVETALKLGGGALSAQVVGGAEQTFSEQYACPVHGSVNLPPMEPRAFSFNNPQGACPTCDGLGIASEFDPALVIPNREISLAGGAIAPWQAAPKAQRRYYDDLVRSLAEHMGFSPAAPVSALAPEQLDALLHGTAAPILLRYQLRGEQHESAAPFEGVIPSLRRRLAEASDDERSQLEPYMTPRTCPACGGARLRPEVLAVTVAGSTIAQVATMPIDQALGWARALQQGDGLGSARQRTIAAPILREILGRLAFLLDVGLVYLTLDRGATTLSGGESQRIRLATQIGAGLSGVLYVLDEPSIGLHPRDTQRLLATLLRLRDLGNSVLVVEHDETIIRAADVLVDIGPGAGEHGGRLVACGSVAEVEQNADSITGQFLSGRRKIATPRTRRGGSGAWLQIQGARGHNLKGIDARLPLGTFIAVTGVSGSGKSTLVNDTLYPRLAQELYGAKQRPAEHDAIMGIEQLDKVIDIDQAPLGRTPRSNPATYTKVFDPIRQLFAQTPEAKARGYDASRFSFNVKGGRCEHCHGEGLIQVEMQFLPDLYVPCEVCGGARYNRETLDIRYRGRTIAEVLDMTVDEAAAFFERHPQIAEKLLALRDVGLGYVRLGQSATTLSGGEAQRIKLAAELGRRATGRTLYILDEPTTGLHIADIERLIQILQRLVDAGNTVLVIEHDLDVIKTADYILDLGPEGGDQGGQIVAAGTPEQVAQVPESHTGRWLRSVL